MPRRGKKKGQHSHSYLQNYELLETQLRPSETQALFFITQPHQRHANWQIRAFKGKKSKKTKKGKNQQRQRQRQIGPAAYLSYLTVHYSDNRVTTSMNQTQATESVRKDLNDLGNDQYPNPANLYTAPSIVYHQAFHLMNAKPTEKQAKYHPQTKILLTF